MFEIGAALSAFSAIKQLGRAVYDSKVDADVKEKAREILDKLGDAQDVLYQLREELLRVQDENARLSRQLAETSDWKAERDAYLLQAAPGGAMVLHHMDKPGLFACPVCANDRKLVPLQDDRTLVGSFTCPGCKAKYPVKASQVDTTRLGR